MKSMAHAILTAGYADACAHMAEVAERNLNHAARVTLADELRKTGVFRLVETSR